VLDLGGDYRWCDEGLSLMASKQQLIVGAIIIVTIAVILTMMSLWMWPGAN
jgi:hypothetical protein